MRKWASALGAAVTIVALMNAGETAAQTVKIGIILTYSGLDSQPGDEADKGLALYLKEHKKDLPAGVSVELVRRDDTGPNPEVAKRLAQELITRDHVQILAGVIYSPNAFAIAPIATEAKVPFVIMNAAGSAITRASPYIVRTSFTIWQQAYPLGKWAARQGWRTAYTAVSDYVPGHDGEAAFTKAFTEAGGRLVGSAHFPLANIEFETIPQVRDPWKELNPPK